MNILLKGIKELKHPHVFFHKLYGVMLDFFAPIISDTFFLKLKWERIMGYPLNLSNPQTFNEKLQWLKLYNRKPEFTQMVDKIEAKKFVAGIIGEEYIIPTIAIYNRVEDIDFDSLPNQFVLKCTHDSGGIVICKDKAKLDKNAALIKLRKGLKTNFYYLNREWPYKNVKPRIIAEKYMTDNDGELKDYKFFCFDGEPRMMFVASDRFNPNEETKFDFFDMDYIHQPFTNGHPNAKTKPNKPQGFEEMKHLARNLSKGIPQVRIDFYEIDGIIYFGEITFFHWSGFVKFEPKEWDYKLGEMIELPTQKLITVQ